MASVAQESSFAVPYSLTGFSSGIISGIALKPINETAVDIQFTLSGLNVSLANALRRTIQDDIPVYVFDTDKCKIEVNTGRLHNEILKHRLQCIPIHAKVGVEEWLTNMPDHNLLEKYVMELDVRNDGEHTMYVSTADFKIKNKTNGRLLTEAEIDRLFPRDPLTNSPIIFARLRPHISDTIPGEHLKLSCEFAISTAEKNSAFTAVCCSAYGNTVDPDAAAAAWESVESLRREEYAKRGEPVDVKEIEFQKKNFMLLDRQRYFVPDSFDFNIESVGMYDCRELCKMASIILRTRFEALAAEIESDNVHVKKSESTMTHCFDFELEHGDYTMGKVLEYILYETGFVAKGREPVLQYCGFKKMHPHDESSIIRVAYLSKHADKNWVKTNLKEACLEAVEIFRAIQSKF
jgi:DNA-directed RNA polymerase subunit L